MKTNFTDAVADSREEFLALAQSASAIYYEVYDELASRDIERMIEESSTDELLLRFNMREHSQAGRSRFCDFGAFARKIYGLPEDTTTEVPLPYFASFLPSYGRVDIAWKPEEIERLIAVTLREKAVMEKIREKHRSK